MISIDYKNKEIEDLFISGKSIAYKAIMNKKMFMMAIYAFKSILYIINNVVELQQYHFLNYNKSSMFSSVTIKSSGVLGNVLFSEKEEGKGIIIYDIIINKDYGKERSI